MEIAVVLIIALLILGPKRLPSAGRSLGEGIRGFKETLSGAKADLSEPEPPPAAGLATPAERETA
ncbi:Sec-independent protein translocase subunit TatA/TatB [Capillimicrobium parvum]|nr:twin-arginine translocase TatA/TatE family subunit [Capillimicrobium parvum]